MANSKEATVNRRNFLSMMLGAASVYPAQAATGTPITNGPGVRMDGQVTANILSAKGFGASGDGAANDTAAMISANSGSANRTLYFPSGVYRAGADVTFDSSVEMWFENGASISVDSGVSVTIEGPIRAGGNQIFSGPGSVKGSDRNGNVLAAWFGVAPVNTAAVNGAALMRMGHFLRRTAGCKIVNFDGGGAYVYDRNEWTKGIRNLVLRGRGSTFKNTISAATWTAQKLAFMSNWNVFNTTEHDAVYSTSPTVFGHLFDTVASGGTAVTTTSASEAGNYAAGNRVLIYGFAQQQDSFPPNARFFEWNEVVSVSATAGAIRLKNKLKFDYDSRWSDLANGPGAPRIINLDRADFVWGDYLELDGMTFLSDLGDGRARGAGIQIEGYRHAVLRDVVAPALNPSICEKVEVISSRFDLVETDKLIDSITYDGCEIQDFLGGTGAHHVNVIGGTKITGRFESHSRNLLIDDAVLACVGSGGRGTVVMTLNPGYAARSIEVRRAKVFPRSTVTGLCAGGVEVTFTVASVASNTKVLVAAATSRAREPFYQKLLQGATYQLQTGAKKVRITKIYQEDGNNVAIEGEFSDTPAIGEIYRGANIQSLGLGELDMDGPYAASMRDINFPRGMKMHTERRDGRHFFVTLSDGDLFRPASGGAVQATDIYVRARLMNAWLTIDKAYTGASGNVQLHVDSVQAAGAQHMAVAATVPGPRQASAFAAAGATAADRITPTNGRFAEQLRVYLAAGSGRYPAYADPTELPKFSIVCEFVQP
jgi:hypothetical protein